MANELPKTITGIPKEAVIEIKISGHFYARLAAMAAAHCGQKTPKEFAEILDRLSKTNAPQDQYEEHMITLMVILHEIETSAKDQGKLITEDLPPNLQDEGTSETAPES